MLTALAVASMGAGVAIAAFSGESRPGTQPIPGPSASPSPGAGGGEFVPVTYPEGDRLVMPVTFPDGTTAELVYPPGLRLQESWIQAFGAFDEGCESDITIVFGDGRDFTRGEEPVAIHAGPAGNRVEVWEAAEPSSNARYYVLFPFGRWTAASHARRTLAAQACAGALDGRDSAGWLLLEAVAPARLVPAGGQMGPQVAFIEVGGVSKRWVLLSPGACDPPPDRPGNPVREFGGVPVHFSATFASWCDPDEPMDIHVYSDGPWFIQQVLRDLEIRDVRVAEVASDQEASSARPV